MKSIFFLLVLIILIIPVVSPITEITADETDLVALKPQAEDPDADNLIYTFSEPLDSEGMWQTTYGDAGEYNITITVSDGELTDSKDVLLIVNKKEEAPVINGFSPADSNPAVDEGSKLNFRVNASDLNNDKLAYLWKLDDNAVSTADSYIYNPDYESAGTHTIEVIVTDDKAEIAQEWAVTVNKVDRSLLLDKIEGITVNEGEAVSLNLPDFKSYSLDYTISEPLGDDNLWQTDYNSSGEYDEKSYSVKVTITDGSFNAFREIQITVKNVDRAAVFAPIGDITMKENQKLTIKLEAADPDGDEVAFSADNMPEGALLDGNAFSYYPGYDVVKKGSLLSRVMDKYHLLSKSFPVTFTAYSRNAKVEQKANIKVMHTNRPFEMGNIDDITVDEGDTITISLRIYDPDNDTLTYQFSGFVDKAVYQTEHDDAGSYIVRVTASDGEFTESRDVKITVNNVNQAPVFRAIEYNQIDEGQELPIKLSASDADGDEVKLSVANPPVNSTLENNIFRWKPELDAVKEDTDFIIAFTASDGSAETRQDANITLRNVNRLPEIINASLYKSFKVGRNKPVVFSVGAEDLDGDELQYKWVFSFLESYDTNTTNAIQRTFTQPGDKKIKVIVSDGKDSASYVWKAKVI